MFSRVLSYHPTHHPTFCPTIHPTGLTQKCILESSCHGDPNDPKTLEQMQEVRLRQARRHRKALRAVQGKPKAILERHQESWRRSRWRVTSGIRRREDEEEITTTFFNEYVLFLFAPLGVILPSSTSSER